MPIENPDVEVLIGINPTNGKKEIGFISQLCSGNEGSELWANQTGTEFFLYHTDEFYDENLNKRRNSMNMISPSKMERLVLWGTVYGVSPLSSEYTLTLTANLNEIGYIQSS